MGKFIDLSGIRFGKLVVLNRVPSKNKDTRWRCLCDCGNYTEASTPNLRKGKVTSCGCYRKECTRNRHTRNIEGETFGKLTVIQKIIVNGRSKCVCLCSCGNKRIVAQDKLTSGVVVSCKNCVEKNKDTIDNKRIFPEWFYDILVESKDREDFLNHSLRTRDAEGNWRKIICRCRKCGSEYKQYVYKFVNTYVCKSLGYCQNCIYALSQSSLEKEIKSYIAEISTENIISNIRNIIDKSGHSLELDMYIPDKKVAVEVNGSFWHSSKGGVPNKDKNRSLLKYKLCKEKGIRLLSIFDIDWWYKQEKVRNILKSLLSSSEKVYARNTNVKQIDKSLGKSFLNQYHLDGDSNQSQIYYGLIDKRNQTLLSVMSFGRLRGQNPNYNIKGSYELVRFVTLPNLKIVGGASKLLHHFEMDFTPQYLLSYSDNDYFTGEVYSKLNFQFQKYTVPDYYWFNTVTKDYLPRWKCQPKKLKEKFPEIASKYSSSIEDNVMIELRYLKVYRCGQSVWIKDYRSK